MKKYIHITKENREFLMKAFGVTGKTVQNAVRFDAERGDTDLAKKIRKVALERGGIVMAVAPEVETLHDADGYMRQYFPNGAMIEVKKENGFYEVLYKGEVVKTGAGLTIAQLEGLQAFAGGLR